MQNAQQRIDEMTAQINVYLAEDNIDAAEELNKELEDFSWEMENQTRN